MYQDSIKAIIKTIIKTTLKQKFPPFVQKSFLASNTDLPRFYHLIKTHKTGPDIKIRPIVSNINGPTQRISWLLSNALKPMLENISAHLENSLELIKCIQAGDLTTNKALPYPCSLDVVSLYTSIPIQEAITNAADRIQNPTLHLSKQDITNLLTVTLNNMYFSFKGQAFRQKRRPTNGFQHFRHSGHTIHGQTRNHCPLIGSIKKLSRRKPCKRCYSPHHRFGSYFAYRHNLGKY